VRNGDENNVARLDEGASERYEDGGKGRGREDDCDEKTKLE
jgi:hypothetical protein